MRPNDLDVILEPNIYITKEEIEEKDKIDGLTKHLHNDPSHQL